MRKLTEEDFIEVLSNTYSTADAAELTRLKSFIEMKKA